jgi:hypothetical protein
MFIERAEDFRILAPDLAYLTSSSPLHFRLHARNTYRFLKSIHKLRQNYRGRQKFR